MNIAENSTPSCATETSTSQESYFFDQAEKEEFIRVLALRKKIKSYCQMVGKIYKNLIGNLEELKKYPQGKALTHNKALTAQEESEAISHICYLRRRIADMQNEISYLTGEGL